MTVKRSADDYGIMLQELLYAPLKGNGNPAVDFCEQWYWSNKFDLQKNLLALYQEILVNPPSRNPLYNEFASRIRRMWIQAYKSFIYVYKGFEIYDPDYLEIEKQINKIFWRLTSLI